MVAILADMKKSKTCEGVFPSPDNIGEPRIEETSAVDEKFELWHLKYRKSGTGCVYQINDHMWEGS